MLQGILEILLAILSAVGLISLVWMILGRRLVAPGEDVLAVVVARGSGAQLEQSVRGLLWLRECDLWRGRLIVADLGLDEEGRRLTRLLCANTEDIILCEPEELPRLISHT